MLENLILMISAYNPDANLELIIKAFNYGERAHENQYRKSGEKYFVHPIEVAKILAELEMDESTIAAGLLHDVLEDTGITYAQMAKDFSVEIADLVDGVTKLGKLSYKTKEETQAENLRKMFMAMGKDIRVILIKLADRLHNMRTLKYMNEEKAKEKALETVEIFVPIAHRLGISKIKWEMEDIALRYIDPTGYYDLVEKVSVKKVERENFIKKLIDLLHTKLKEVSINDADISGRAKHFYSIYKKMKNQNKIFDEIYDLMAVRIIVDDIKDCYGALGVVHTIWKPMPGRFKDYIAMPKPNMYQSIHTTVIGSDGLPFEIQIRTKEMHKVAEFGIAAHWKYKEGKSASAGTDMDDKLAWLRQMMEWQKDVSDSKEFMDSVKLDLFTDEVFVFTPKGEVVELAAESTPLDFAYKVHTGVGNRCVGAKVDGKIVPLDFQLNSGNIVEILTSANSSGPSRDWLNIVKSSHARNKIRQWFKKERREENIEKGREMLERETKRNGFPLSDFLKTKYLTAILKPLSQNAIEDLYAALGYGGLTMGQVFPKIKEKYEVDHKLIKEEKIEKLEDVKLASKLPIKKPQSSTGDSGVSVKGIDNILIRFAKCCNPLPGDDIIGYITKGRGVSVHRTDCAQINLDDREKVVDVIWNSEDLSKKNFEVEIQIDADDRRGLFMDVSKFLADEKIAVNGINARSAKDGTAIMNIIIEVQSKEQLKSIKNKIRRIEGVVGAFRV